MCAACIACAAVLLMVAWLYGAVWLVTTDEATYTAVYESENVYVSSGVDRETLHLLTQDIIAYLRGDLPELDRRAVVDGVERDAFRARERQHMDDVRGLYRLGERLAQGCSALAVLLLLIAWQRLRREKEASARIRAVGKGLLWGVGAFCAALLLLVLWAAIDFQGLFIQFHHLVFTNDLWLLDPREELLIRMMPTALFMRAAGRIALMAGAALVGLGIAGAVLATRKENPIVR